MQVRAVFMLDHLLWRTNTYLLPAKCRQGSLFQAAGLQPGEGIARAGEGEWATWPECKGHWTGWEGGEADWFGRESAFARRHCWVGRMQGEGLSLAGPACALHAERMGGSRPKFV